MFIDERNAALVALRSSIRTYSIALEESLKLQSHYAGLLNMHDGGERLQFKYVYEWIERLKKVGIINE